MNADKLFEIGEKFYHNGPQIFKAIDAFETLINLHPSYVKGWEYLATMYFENTEFDKWLKTIDQAIDLSPNNIRTKEIKNTCLSLMSKFIFENGHFFNEKTREAYEIRSFQNQNDIKKAFFVSTSELLKLNKEDSTKSYNYIMKLGHLSRDLKEYNNAIDYFQKASNNIPDKFNDERKLNTTRLIEKLISMVYFDIENFEKSLIHLKKAFSLGLDEYSKMFEADIYQAMGDDIKMKKTLESLADSIEIKLKSKPEQAYISQQINVFLRLKMPEKAYETLKYFESLPNNDFHITRKKEFTKKIENYP